MTEDFPFVSRPSAVGGRRPDNWQAHATQFDSFVERDNEAQIVVAVTHIGVEEELRLAQTVPGIDIIFGGHSHEYVPKVLETERNLVAIGGEKARPWSDST